MFNGFIEKVTRHVQNLPMIKKGIDQLTGSAHMQDFILKDFYERSMLLQGRMAANSFLQGKQINDLSEVEFRVFSQWGEDGIIDWLVKHVPVPTESFIEFGVETFREANCRFLLQNRNWKGLVMDGSEEYMHSLQTQQMFWMHDLTAKPAFIDKDNINSHIEDAGFGGDVGILSIDIDGNDYWVWDAISCVDPAIVICEYNPILGDQHAITVPYDPKFYRMDAHYCGLYFGASIKALLVLAKKKGYTFVGSNSNGINAFFVRNDLAKHVENLIKDYKSFPSRHRDSRDSNGNLNFTGGVSRFDLISDQIVVDLKTGEEVALSSLDQPYSENWLKYM